MELQDAEQGVEGVVVEGADPVAEYEKMKRLDRIFQNDISDATKNPASTMFGKVDKPAKAPPGMP